MDRHVGRIFKLTIDDKLIIDDKQLELYQLSVLPEVVMIVILLNVLLNKKDIIVQRYVCLILLTF